MARRNVTVISSSGGFRSRAEARSLAKALGLAQAESISPAALYDFLAPRLHAVFKDVDAAHKKLLATSSMFGGSGSGPDRAGGVKYTGRLRNCLREVPFSATARGRGQVRGTWAIVAASPENDPDAFERADEGWTNAEVPNMTALFEWAKKRFKWNVPTPQGENFLGQLDGYKVSIPGSRVKMSVGWLFWRFLQSLAGKTYPGLKLKENVQKTVAVSLAKRAGTRGGVMSREEILRLLTSGEV
jgi:hypothetical protein